MTNARPRNVHSSEFDNRADWWLREYGRFPTRDVLRRIRDYRRTQPTTEKENQHG